MKTEEDKGLEEKFDIEITADDEETFMCCRIHEKSRKHLAQIAKDYYLGVFNEARRKIFPYLSPKKWDTSLLSIDYIGKSIEDAK